MIKAAGHIKLKDINQAKDAVEALTKPPIIRRVRLWSFGVDHIVGEFFSIEVTYRVVYILIRLFDSTGIPTAVLDGSMVLYLEPIFSIQQGRLSLKEYSLSRFSPYAGATQIVIRRDRCL